MKYTRIAAAVPRVHLADVEANKKEILGLLEKASGQEAQIVVFPELAVIGATCGDLVYQEILMDAFDLSSLPFLLEVGRKGTVARKYTTLVDK